MTSIIFLIIVNTHNLHDGSKNASRILGVLFTIGITVSHAKCAIHINFLQNKLTSILSKYKQILDIPKHKHKIRVYYVDSNL